MDRRVTDVDAHRASAVPVLYRGQALTGLFKGQLPGDGVPPAWVPALRLEDPVRIGLHVRNRRGFRAQMTATEGVVPIAAHLAHRGPFELDGQTTHRLAEHAGVQAQVPISLGSHGSISSRSSFNREVRKIKACNPVLRRGAGDPRPVHGPHPRDKAQYALPQGSVDCSWRAVAGFTAGRRKSRVSRRDAGFKRLR